MSRNEYDTVIQHSRTRRNTLRMYVRYEREWVGKVGGFTHWCPSLKVLLQQPKSQKPGFFYSRTVHFISLPGNTNQRWGHLVCYGWTFNLNQIRRQAAICPSQFHSWISFYIKLSPASLLRHSDAYRKLEMGDQQIHKSISPLFASLFSFSNPFLWLEISPISGYPHSFFTPK